MFVCFFWASLSCIFTQQQNSWIDLCEIITNDKNRQLYWLVSFVFSPELSCAWFNLQSNAHIIFSKHAVSSMPSCTCISITSLTIMNNQDVWGKKWSKASLSSTKSPHRWNQNLLVQRNVLKSIISKKLEQHCAHFVSFFFWRSTLHIIMNIRGT